MKENDSTCTALADTVTKVINDRQNFMLRHKRLPALTIFLNRRFYSYIYELCSTRSCMKQIDSFTLYKNVVRLLLRLYLRKKSRHTQSANGFCIYLYLYLVSFSALKYFKCMH